MLNFHAELLSVSSQLFDRSEEVYAESRRFVKHVDVRGFADVTTAGRCTILLPSWCRRPARLVPWRRCGGRRRRVCDTTPTAPQHR